MGGGALAGGGDDNNAGGGGALTEEAAVGDAGGLAMNPAGFVKARAIDDTGAKAYSEPLPSMRPNTFTSSSRATVVTPRAVTA